MAEGILTTAEIREPNMTRESIVRLQVMLYCHLHNIHITESDLQCLTLIGLRGKSLLNDICNDLVNTGNYSSSQSIRNCLDELETKGLIVKERLKGRYKTVALSEIMKIQSVGDAIILDMKCMFRSFV